ncbi:MAG: helix-turn-helix transcriptional regulator [Oceanicaulis sp.]
MTVSMATDPHMDALKQSAADPLQVLVTPQRALIGANLSADAILRRGDVLCVEEGRIVALKPELEAPIAALVANASHKGYRTLIACPGEDGAVTWAASSKILLAMDAAPQSILVTARPLIKSEPLTGPDLVALFNLTPAEARLAVELAAGHSLADISAKRQIHISTLRAQLRSIFTKTGVSKQSEFVSSVWRAAAV